MVTPACCTASCPTDDLDQQIEQARSERQAATHPDLPALAEKVRQLSEETEYLRGLLRQRGTEPEEDTA